MSGVTAAERTCAACGRGFTGKAGRMVDFAELYLQKCPAVIISSLVAPCSSGCPVLTRDGR